MLIAASLRLTDGAGGLPSLSLLAPSAAKIEGEGTRVHYSVPQTRVARSPAVSGGRPARRHRSGIRRPTACARRSKVIIYLRAGVIVPENGGRYLAAGKKVQPGPRP